MLEFYKKKKKNNCLRFGNTKNDLPKTISIIIFRKFTPYEIIGSVLMPKVFNVYGRKILNYNIPI